VSDGDRKWPQVWTWPQVFNLRVPRPGCASPLGPAHARRRTLAAPILGFTRSVLTRFGILPPLVSKRRLSGTGSPSLPRHVLRKPNRVSDGDR